MDKWPNNIPTTYAVKFTREQATKAHRRSRGIALLFLNLGARWGCVVNATPGRITPGKEPVGLPIYRRLGGPQSRSGQVRKISPLPGFDPRTVQPVASRYTDYAARPTLQIEYCVLNFTVSA